MVDDRQQIDEATIRAEAVVDAAKAYREARNDYGWACTHSHDDEMREAWDMILEALRLYDAARKEGGGESHA